jgi:hypothetical protein
MSTNRNQLEEHRSLIRRETQLFLDELYDLKRLVRTMEALARLVMVGVVLCLGALVLAMLFFFWTLAMR